MDKKPYENDKNDALENTLASLYSPKAPQSFETAWRAAVRREESLRMSETKKRAGKPLWQRIGRVAAPVLAALVLVAGAQWVGENPQLQNGTASMKNATTFVAKRVADTAYLQEAEAPTAANEEWEGAWAYDEDMAMTGAMSGGASSGGLAESGSVASAPAADTASGAQEMKLVRTADITLATTTFDVDDEALRAQAAAHGGYVESLYQYGDGSENQLRRITYSLRIPSEQLDAFLAGAAGIGRVTARSETATDRTVQYADTSLRLQTQKEKMARLQELLKNAETVSDLLEIETEIANAQYEIESMETALRSIDRQVENSAVSVTLVEESPAQKAAETAVSLGDRIKNGLAASVKGLGQFFQNMLVFLVMALPVLVPLLVVFVIWILWRRGRRSKKATGKEPDDGRTGRDIRDGAADRTTDGEAGGTSAHQDE